jgi:hypothetical protein
MHYRRVLHVAIGENDSVDITIANDPLHLLLFQDRDPFRVLRARQLGWIATVGYVGYLSRGESDYPELSVVTKHDVEVVKIPASSAQNEYSLHGSLSDTHQSMRIIMLAVGEGYKQ